MKSLVLAAMCSLALTATVFAQIDSSHMKTTEISLEGGSSIAYLPKELKDNWKGGWHAGGSFGLTMVPGSAGYTSVLLSVDVNRFAFDYRKYRDNLLPAVVNSSRNPSWMVSAMAEFRGTVTSLSSRFHPYFLVGVGYMHASEGEISISGDIVDTIPSVSKSAFAWMAGVGFDIPITDQIGIFAYGKSLLGVADPAWQCFPIGGGIRYRIQH